MRISFAWLLFLSIVTASSGANDYRNDDLFTLLEQESELAAISKRNIDYLPGLITVLQQNELKRFGFKTVQEALEMVPGVDFSLTVRGFANAHFSGKTKIMLNGVAFNDTTTSAATYLLQLPVEAVERIEVIRGPGSALYGEYAYSGVINIVTVKETDMIFAGYHDYGHDHDGRHGGIAAFYKGTDLSMQLIATDAASDGPYTHVKSDAIYQQFPSNTPVSHAPGPAELLNNERFYLFDLQYKDFSLSAYSMDSAEGEGFGFGNTLPEDDGKSNMRVVRKTYEARQRLRLNDVTQLRVKAGLLASELHLDDFYIFPEGFTNIHPFSDGVIAGLHTKEEREYGTAEFVIEAFSAHTLLFGAESSRSRITDGYIEGNIDPMTYEPLGSVQRYSGAFAPLTDQAERRVSSLFIQDEWCATEKTTVTFGVRYDDYDDIGTNTSPRLAAVYELNPFHLFKIQYAQAFRPPNFLELYIGNNPFITGDATLQAETVDTAEAAYIYNNQEEIVRLKLYRSVLHDLIALAKQNSYYGTFADLGTAVVQGAEAEFEKRYFDETTIRAHLAYTDSENDIDTVNHYAAVTGSAGISKRLYRNFGAALLYRYTGTRQRQEGDSRKEMAEEHRLDLTLFNDHTGVKNLHIKAGVKNLLDAPTANPAPADTYEDDYQAAGRNYWLKAEYRF